MKFAITASMAVMLATTIVCPISASAQVQTKEQQACLNGANKGMLKAAGLSAKLFSACNKDQANGNTPSAPSCVLADPKLTELTAKNCEAEVENCTMAPGFGFTSCGYVAGFAPYLVAGHWADLFASEGGVTVCETDKDGCKCQGKVFKSGLKLYTTYMKLFNACKKSGLASDSAPITDTAGLAACFGVDPKLTISKAETKLADTVTKACEGVAVPFPLGDCGFMTGNFLSDCVARSALCHSCRAISASDNLAMDCDLLDDSLDNESCGS